MQNKKNLQDENRVRVDKCPWDLVYTRVEGYMENKNIVALFQCHAIFFIKFKKKILLSVYVYQPSS